MSDLDSLSDLSSLSESERESSVPTSAKSSTLRVLPPTRKIKIEAKPKSRSESKAKPESEPKSRRQSKRPVRESKKAVQEAKRPAREQKKRVSESDLDENISVLDDVEGAVEEEEEEEKEEETGKKTEEQKEQTRNQEDDDSMSVSSPELSDSEPESTLLADNPDIAFIVMFRSRFDDAFPPRTPKVGPQDIERGVVDSQPSPQVENLLCGILSVLLNRKKPIEQAHYNRALEDAVSSYKSEWPMSWNGVNPIAGSKTFQTINPTERLTLLRALILWSLHGSEAISNIIKTSYKGSRHEDDKNQSLSVQPWGKDGDRNRYWLIEGRDDTCFRLYRESMSYTKKRKWRSVAGSLSELRETGERLSAETSQASKRLGERILTALPRFEATEEKIKRREYRLSRKAYFSQPPAYPLFESRRTRGRRVNYNFSDNDGDDFDTASPASESNHSSPAPSALSALPTRRSARAAAMAAASQTGSGTLGGTKDQPAQSVVTGSGRVVRTRVVREDGTVTWVTPGSGGDGASGDSQSAGTGRLGRLRGADIDDDNVDSPVGTDGASGWEGNSTGPHTGDNTGTVTESEMEGANARGDGGGGEARHGRLVDEGDGGGGEGGGADGSGDQGAPLSDSSIGDMPSSLMITLRLGKSPGPESAPAATENGATDPSSAVENGTRKGNEPEGGNGNEYRDVQDHDQAAKAGEDLMEVDDAEAQEAGPASSAPESKLDSDALEKSPGISGTITADGAIADTGAAISTTGPGEFIPPQSSATAVAVAGSEAPRPDS